MSEIIIIGLFGRAGSGKDSIASYLEGAYGFHRIAIADGVREALRSLDGPGMNITKRDGCSVRRALQMLGTECGRSVDSLLWLKLFHAKLNFLRHYVHGYNKSIHIVVPDGRFPNEKDGLQAMADKFIAMHIVRPAPDSLGIETRHHSSETGLADIEYDKTIENTGTRRGLCEEVAAILFHKGMLHKEQA